MFPLCAVGSKTPVYIPVLEVTECCSNWPTVYVVLVVFNTLDTIRHNNTATGCLHYTLSVVITLPLGVYTMHCQV